MSDNPKEEQVIINKDSFLTIEITGVGSQRRESSFVLNNNKKLSGIDPNNFIVLFKRR